MSHRVPFLLLCLVLCLAFAERTPSAVIFKPGKRAKYLPPGQQLIVPKANEMFAQAEAAQNAGETGRAMKIYKKLVKRYPHANVSPEATFRVGKLYEARRDLLHAAQVYRGLMESYPQTEHFQEAIEAQFRIGEIYLNGKKRRIWGIPVASGLDDAIEIFAGIVRSAPYGRYTARAQYDIARARELQGSADLAIDAYQSVVEKFPNDPVAIDAQYQIGYIWLQAARSGANDPDAVAKARTAFEDFLFRYPKSEKAPQARENLAKLQQRVTKSSLGIAQYYDRTKHYRAAVVYYNEVIRQQPGSAESEVAKKRIEQLRSKVGDQAIKSAAEIAEQRAKANSSTRSVARGPASSSAPAGVPQTAPAPPQMRGSGDDISPLPPPADADSLPPAPGMGNPGSSLPDTATPSGNSAAPEPSPSPDTTTTP